MPIATPDTLGDVLNQVIRESAQQAAAAPEKLQNWFAQVGELAEDVKRAPADALDTLEHLVNPPDWWSLLVLVLMQVGKLDPRMSVGAMQPPGWSRTITVTFTEGPGAVTAGLALTDPGLIHGLLLRSHGDVDTGPLRKGPLTLSVRTTGVVTWEVPFGGTVARPAVPATLDATITWNPDVNAVGDLASFSLGVARVAVRLSSLPAEPLYKVTIGLGEEDGTAGATAKVDVGRPLGGLVSIGSVSESYSPKLVLAQDAAPRFTLGHRGV